MRHSVLKIKDKKYAMLFVQLDRQKQ